MGARVMAILAVSIVWPPIDTKMIRSSSGILGDNFLVKHGATGTGPGGGDTIVFQVLTVSMLLPARGLLSQYWYWISAD